MGVALVLLIMFVTLLVPYIICAIVAVILINIYHTKLIKSKVIKILMIISILLCVFILVFKFRDVRPDTLCAEMNEINDDQSLIGLSEEQVIELLGEPEYKRNEENNIQYRYDAGSLDKGLFLFNTAIFFDSSYSCRLWVIFDENGKVKNTSIQYIG